MILAQLSDMHIRPRGAPAYRVVETNALVERALRTVASLRPAPDAVIMSGDLTDCGLAEEYDILADLIRRYCAMPVYLVPGNHDRREVMRARLSHLPGIAAAPDFIQYVIDDFPLRLIMLDSVVPGFGHGELCVRRLEFLDGALSMSPAKPSVVVLHHPPVLCGIEHMDHINLRSAEAFGAIIARHPQVERVLCGHHHRPITARFAGTIVQVAPSTAHQVSFDLGAESPASFTMEPPAFLVHRWSAETGVVSHGVFVEAYPGPYPFVLDPNYPGAMRNSA